MNPRVLLAVHNPRLRRGVTLLELMVVLAVMAVLCTLAVPSMGQRLERQRLVGAAETLAADLAEARFEAARSGLAVHIESRPGPAWCWAVATTPHCGCDQPAPCQLKTVRNTDHPGVSLQGAVHATLDPTGTGHGGVSSTTFESRGGERLRVDVGSMGRPRICKPDGASGSAAARSAALTAYPRC